MNNKYIRLATAAFSVFSLSCTSANAYDLPDINLDILGNDDISNSLIDETISSAITEGEVDLIVIFFLKVLSFVPINKLFI